MPRGYRPLPFENSQQLDGPHSIMDGELVKLISLHRRTPALIIVISSVNTGAQFGARHLSRRGASGRSSFFLAEPTARARSQWACALPPLGRQVQVEGCAVETCLIAWKWCRPIGL